MIPDLTRNVAGGLANAVAVLLAAPFCEGVLRKVTACLQSRRGPPLCQPYFDLLKLLGKEDIESGESPGVQRVVAWLSLASVLTLACMVPMGFPAPMNGAGDVVLLIYVLTLCGICTLIGGLAAGSTYSLLGTGREMMTMIALEPLFAIALLIGALHVRSFRLDDVLNGSVYAARGIPWSGLILLAVMAFSFQAFVQRLPFDIAGAGLFVALFVPWGSSLSFPLGWIFFWAKVLVLVLLVTAVAATHARYRIDQAIRYFAGLLAVGFAALALAGYGH
jgi:formate hydrogenlyase subunit 4